VFVLGGGAIKHQPGHRELRRHAQNIGTAANSHHPGTCNRGHTKQPQRQEKLQRRKGEILTVWAELSAGGEKVALLPPTDTHMRVSG